MSVGVEERAVVRNAGWAIVVVMLADEAKRRDLGAARVETPAAMGRGRRGTAETTAEQATSSTQQQQRQFKKKMKKQSRRCSGEVVERRWYTKTP